MALFIYGTGLVGPPCPPPAFSVGADLCVRPGADIHRRLWSFTPVYLVPKLLLGKFRMIVGQPPPAWAG